jgi:Ca2+-transporting ATPase
MSNFHSLSIDPSVSKLGSNAALGLSQTEVKKRQKKYGPNSLPETKPPSLFYIFLKQFNNFFVYILFAATIITFFLHEHINTGAIMLALLINVFLGFLQEAKAQKTVSALKKIVTITTKVLRKGKIKTVDSRELVPGDVVFIDAGDKIPADARLISALSFQVNEAALAGESMPSKKDPAKILKEKTPLADRENMVYMGTVAISGKATALITNTGTSSEIGKVAQLLKEVREKETPLQSRIKKLSLQSAFAILVILLIIIVAGLLKGIPPAQMFIYAVAIAVSAVPEGLILAVTFILALSMRRILKRKALVRELLAAETLGSTMVICTDKTGTITSGEMRVEKIITAQKSYFERDLPDKKNGDLAALLEIGMLCNDIYFEDVSGSPEKWKISGDPTEKALVLAAAKIGLKRESLEKDLEQVDEIPFDSYLKYMATAHRDKKSNKIKIFIKGATERLLPESAFLYSQGEVVPLTQKDKEHFTKINEDLSKEAYRVISCAMKEIDVKDETLDLKKEVQSSLVFCGTIAIRDPIRPSVEDAIKLCQDAGIEVKMITGDHKLTAQAIGREIGINASISEILSGEDMDFMDPEQLELRIPKTKIFARVAPKHKLQIIDSLQASKKITAMTGDGVNDAPALKSADIGIAMGTGTEVAKEASDIILLDNNFKTIETTVEEGRSIFDNIRKVTTYLFSGSFSGIILVGGGIFLGLPLPLLPTQILWINIVVDSFPAFALATTPKEEDVMKYPPRKLDESILDRESKILIFFVGIITSLVLFGIFAYFWQTTHNLSYVRSIVFAGLGIASVFFIFSYQSLRFSIFHKNPFSNKFLTLSSLAGLLMICLAIYLPPLQAVFKTVPLGFLEWGILFGFGILNILLIEVVKLIFIFLRKKRLKNKW